MQLRFAEDRFTVPLFCAASKRHCIWKRQGKNNSCTPKSLSLSRFSIPLATARVVGALVSSFSGVRCKGTGEFISVQLRCRQLFVHSFNFNVLALHMEKRGSVVSSNYLDREVKGHGNFEHRQGSFGRIFNTWERVFVRYDINDLFCIHHHLDVARQLHQEMAIFDEYLVLSKAQMGNTPKFPSLASPSLFHSERVLIRGSGCKDIALYNVQGSISRSWQISGQCKQSGSRGERAWKVST